MFRTLRNNWKKSTFAVCVLSYGGHWLYGVHGKANKLFEKNAVPLLHLAGVEITIVKTDYEGQANKLMELMEHTDILVVARGDGTLQEVVTGLLRRPDQDTVCNTPIGFIRLVSRNSLIPSLHLLSDNKVKDITSATLSILKGETVPLDVLQIKGEKEQPVFALTGLRMGAFRDVASTISKYCYLGPLKTSAAHWFSTLREWPLVREVSVSYLAPSLRPPDLPTQKPPRPNLLHRIIRRLQNRWNPPGEERPKVEEPEQWKEKHLSTLELFIHTHNKNPVKRRINDSLVICAEPDNFTVGEYITVGSLQKSKRGGPDCIHQRLHKTGSQCLPASAARGFRRLPQHRQRGV
uniref:acylglycerol kinase, mitochondrial-like isoform X2 n=1 Tax=Gasterosteus aculeatus aculeatus TaxID=481459 RepID=UPI001A996CB1|nr:acylglycerol kinase, mitochondrial-like isoform X2 [Gasterosteus aculeatus aculeatus]